MAYFRQYLTWFQLHFIVRTITMYADSSIFNGYILHLDPTRDIAVLHMMSSDANMADLTQLGLQVLELATKQEIDEFSNQIEFHGTPLLLVC